VGRWRAPRWVAVKRLWGIIYSGAGALFERSFLSYVGGIPGLYTRMGGIECFLPKTATNLGAGGMYRTLDLGTIIPRKPKWGHP
jgi:hypothetical protein